MLTVRIFNFKLRNRWGCSEITSTIGVDVDVDVGVGFIDVLSPSVLFPSALNLSVMRESDF